MKRDGWFPYLLLVVYFIYFIIFAINPIDRVTWLSENSVTLILVLGLVFTYKKFKFSNVSYALMFTFITLHTIGGHYTFANVPFDFITNLFGFTRNNFDKFAHFAVGFFAYPIAELVMRSKKVKSKKIVLFFAFCAIVAWAGFYEVFEWVYAEVSPPDLRAAFLGSQGDIWDAQKDILMDVMGAIISLFAFSKINKKELKKLK